jgi:hypothetical protein
MWLLLLDLILYSAYGLIESLPDPMFNIFGIGTFATTVLLFVMTGMLFSSISASTNSLPTALIILGSCGAAISIFHLPLFAIVAHTPIASASWPAMLHPLFVLWAVFTLWTLVTIYRVAIQLYQLHTSIAWFMVSLYALLNIGIVGLLSPQKTFIADYRSIDDTRLGRDINVEDVFYSQSSLVDGRLAGLQTQTPGKPDLYYLGFAGKADEKVFTNEVLFVNQLVGRKYLADKRSILLMNSFDHVKQHPMANRHNLERAVHGIAARMDKEEDVLFLFLTSHGAEDRQLSVSFWPMELNDLKASELRSILDASGIRNRVIVISACYSGGFIDALRDEYTLIVTASSKDRVSYGCGDATEYTYFSEAYFVRSMAAGRSFIGAFEQARQLVSSRELKEGKRASLPEMYVGSKIRSTLNNLEIPEARKVQ